MLGLNDSGFVLRLGPDAGIEAIAGHGSGAGLSEWVGRPFPTLLDPSALGRALDFFTRVRAEGAQYRWDLPLAGSRRILMFAGATAGPAVLVAAAASVTALDLRLAGWDHFSPG